MTSTEAQHQVPVAFAVAQRAQRPFAQCGSETALGELSLGVAVDIASQICRCYMMLLYIYIQMYTVAGG